MSFRMKPSHQYVKPVEAYQSTTVYYDPSDPLSTGRGKKKVVSKNPGSNNVSSVKTGSSSGMAVRAVPRAQEDYL